MITNIKDFLKESNKPAVLTVNVNENHDNITTRDTTASVFHLFDTLTTLIDEGVLNDDMVIIGLTLEEINDVLKDEGKFTYTTMENLLNDIERANKIIEFAKTVEITESISSIFSNFVYNDKQMGLVMEAEFDKFVNFYTKSKSVNIEGLDGKVIASSGLTVDEFKQAFELGKTAKFFTKDIKFENDNQKLAWSYLKGRATKIMHLRAGNPIGPHS